MHRRHVVLGGLAAFFVRDVCAEGVARVRGAALINGIPSKAGATVKAGDTIVTGPKSDIAFTIGRDALLVRENSNLTLAQDGFRLVTGAVLGVFAPRQRKQLQTNTATIGIRGTAVYLEAERSRTYACTCFGETVLAPLDGGNAETVRPTQRHDARYVHARTVARAPMINHTEAELDLLQKLLPKF